MPPQGGTLPIEPKEEQGYMKYGHLMTNGFTMPPIGLGCWMGNANEDEVRRTIWNALSAGYRYFDTATLYGNEKIVGDVLHEAMEKGVVTRSELFISTKLSFISHRPEHAAKAIEKSLQVLGVDYLDIYLMHTPLPFKPNDDCSLALRHPDGSFIVDDTPLIDTWRVLERYYKQGVIRSLGVSNFSIPQIQDILEQCEVPPHNLQMEVHIYLAQEDLVNFCKSHGITVTGYSTLGSPGRKDNPVGSFIDGSCLDDPLVQELAEKYNKTAGQILLRHSVQRGLIVIPKSSNLLRLEKNLNIFDFHISKEDMGRLNGLDQDKHFFPFDFAYHHPNYPYKKPVDHPLTLQINEN